MSLIQSDCDRRDNSQSCSAWYIAGRLGHRDRTAVWIFSQIQQLTDHAGFPPPIIRLVNGLPAEGIKHSTRWQRAAVDRWFDAQPSARLAPSLADAAADLEAERVERELERRAHLVATGQL